MGHLNGLFARGGGRDLSMICRWGEKSRVADGHKLPGGGGGDMPLRKFLEMNMC